MSSHPSLLPHAENVSSTVLSADLLHASSRVLFRSVCSSLLVVSPHGQIMFANDAAESMIGCSSDEMTGRAFNSLFLPESEDADSAPECLTPAIAMGTLRTRRTMGALLCNNGANLPVRVNIRSMMDESGEVFGDVITVEDLSDYMQMSEYVTAMAHHDLQTGLPKSEAILSKIDAAIQRLQTSDVSFALAEIGVDHLRRINESVGHAAGDKVLREVGKRLEANLGKDGMLTRSAGAGFIALFTECSSQEAAMERASALLRGFREPFQVEDYVVRLTASLGMSFATKGKVSQQSIRAEAELALRRSKSLGGNQVTSFGPEMADWHSRAVQTESKMQLALEREEFFVVYQPQICLKTGKLTGVEALLRWKSAEDGLIMPNDFIPVAEETGMIIQLGEWCLRKACRDVAALQKRLGYPVMLAVNVSPKQARDEKFCEVVEGALEASGLPRNCLEVEITEGLLISHEDEALQVIANLQKMGISVAMDDFGTGFCNLGYITRFKVDRLKIDRSFIRGCVEDRNSTMITTSIMFLAKSLGIQVVAEGVETEEQSEMLRKLECEVAQGYLYSRPTTLDEVHAQAQRAADACYQKAAERMKAQSESICLTGKKARSEEIDTNVVIAVDTSEKPAFSKDAVFKAPGTASTLTYLEAREPICRPSKPVRKGGAARVRWQAVEEAEETGKAATPNTGMRGPVFTLFA